MYTDRILFQIYTSQHPFTRMHTNRTFANHTQITLHVNHTQIARKSHANRTQIAPQANRTQMERKLHANRTQIAHKSHTNRTQISSHANCTTTYENRTWFQIYTSQCPITYPKASLSVVTNSHSDVLKKNTVPDHYITMPVHSDVTKSVSLLFFPRQQCTNMQTTDPILTGSTRKRPKPKRHTTFLLSVPRLL